MENHLNSLNFAICHAGSKMNYCVGIDTAVYVGHSSRSLSSSEIRVISVNDVFRRDWFEW